MTDVQATPGAEADSAGTSVMPDGVAAPASESDDVYEAALVELNAVDAPQEEPEGDDDEAWLTDDGDGDIAEFETAPADADLADEPAPSEEPIDQDDDDAPLDGPIAYSLDDLDPDAVVMYKGEPVKVSELGNVKGERDGRLQVANEKAELQKRYESLEQQTKALNEHYTADRVGYGVLAVANDGDFQQFAGLNSDQVKQLAGSVEGRGQLSSLVGQFLAGGSYDATTARQRADAAEKERLRRENEQLKGSTQEQQIRAEAERIVNEFRGNLETFRTETLKRDFTSAEIEGMNKFLENWGESYKSGMVDDPFPDPKHAYDKVVKTLRLTAKPGKRTTVPTKPPTGAGDGLSDDDSTYLAAAREMGWANA